MGTLGAILGDLWVLSKPYLPLGSLIIIPLTWKCALFAKSMSDKTEALVNSIKAIENAVTSVDLVEMAQQISQISGTPGKTIGNTVLKELPKAGISVAISLHSLGEESSVNFRFSQAVDYKALREILTQNEEIKNEEEKLFGKASKLIAYSPRGLRLEIPSNNLDNISKFTALVTEIIDESLSTMTTFEKEFDEKLEKILVS